MKLLRLLGGLGLLVALTDILGRAAGLGALGAGPRDSGRVALTFDDGPSERTPELLRILAKHGAKATFFVTRDAAVRYPQHLQAMLDAGHEVEAHGVWHRHALTLPPWQEWAQVTWHPRAGQRGPLLYRPPFGGHSPLTRLIAGLTGRRIALWDVEGRDWTASPAPELAAHTLERVQPGSVILLHDGPEVTAALLDMLLRGLTQRGLRGVTALELPMQPIALTDGLRRLPQSYGGG